MWFVVGGFVMCEGCDGFKFLCFYYIPFSDSDFCCWFKRRVSEVVVVV